MLSAEIIAIGSELLTPDRTDTNSLWLTGKLNEIGIDVMLKTVVGDDESRLEEVIRDALKRSSVVITTGGLGPTDDDITRQVAAKATDRELEYHIEIEDLMRKRFKNWGREMPEINKRQAYVLKGAEVLPNPNGSAVGMLLRENGKFFVVLPGPPRENQPMFEEHVFEKLKELAGDVVARRRTLRVSGMGESALDEIIAPIYREFKDVQTSVLFNKTEIEVQLATKASTEVEAEGRLDELSSRIAGALGIAVFSTNGELMEEVVGRLLTERKATLATAESCTGGLIGERLTEISGSSKFYMEGIISYSNDAKIRTLNVPEKTLKQFGAVSHQTAEAMAKGARERADTDYAISVTGVAGPDGGTKDKPVGTVYLGYADRDTVKSVKLMLPGDRYLIRWRSSQAALDYLRRQLLKSGDQAGT